MLSFKTGTGLTDAEYIAAKEVEDEIVFYLNEASLDVEAALTGALDYKVDSAEQREYIRTQIDSMTYVLKRIRDNLED